MAKILVVDDDKDIQRLLEFTLKRVGHTVITASNGEIGLAETKSQKPDLIVCDIMMPKMTGYDFCKKVRADSTVKHIPIIMFSARFQPIDKQTALDAGATDYLPKSTAPDALVSRITELLPTATTPKTVAKGSIGLFSLRGGAGTTSLAVNLAIALALTQKTGVGLVDLALQGGHTAVMLGMRPTSNFIQAAAAVKNNSDSAVIKSHFMKHSSGIELLASPPTFMQTSVDNSLVNMINTLNSIYPITVLDMPHILESKFSPLLQHLDKLILVLAADMPSLQSTAIALQGLQKFGLSDKKIELVVNQVTPYHTLPLETIQKVLKRPIKAAIPFEADMVKAVNSGKPLILSTPQSPATAAIGKLAQTILT